MSIHALCKPRPSVFAADRRATVLNLDTFLKGQVNGPEFFEENFFTNGMLTLVDRAFRHLGGAGAGSSVFLLSQAMGDGKTHSMIALGLLARDPELRIKVLGEFAIRETTAADNSPEPGRQYLRDTFGQGYWGKREGFIGLLEWLAALGNAEGMDEWIADSAGARILAGRLRNDHA